MVKTLSDSLHESPTYKLCSFEPLNHSIPHRVICRCWGFLHHSQTTKTLNQLWLEVSSLITKNPCQEFTVNKNILIQSLSSSLSSLILGRNRQSVSCLMVCENKNVLKPSIGTLQNNIQTTYIGAVLTTLTKSDALAGKTFLCMHLLHSLISWLTNASIPGQNNLFNRLRVQTRPWWPK